jgi:hypothetical protein
MVSVEKSRKKVENHDLNGGYILGEHRKVQGLFTLWQVIAVPE